MFSDVGPSGFFNPQQQQQNNPNNQRGGYNRNDNQNQQMRRSKVFTPVTVRMVMNAVPRPDDVCEFDGDPISDIILTGRLIRRQEEPMRTQFEINDNTGTFFVIFYHKGENQIPTALKSFQYEQFCYAKVYGNIRVFKEEKAIVGTHIKRITQFDEFTNHFLGVFTAHAIRKKGVLKPRELQMVQVDHQPAPVANQNQTTGGNNNQGRKTPNANSNQQNQLPHGASLRETLLQLMREMRKTNKFVLKNDLYAMVQNSVERHNFEGEMEAMKSDGVISEAFDKDSYLLVEE